MKPPLKNKGPYKKSSKSTKQDKPPYKERARSFSKPKPARKNPETKTDDTLRLNKYISNAGVCSRREADVLISSGAIKVNGKVVTELGTKIKPTDKVQYDGELLKSEKDVYLLLNKPKDFLTTTDDPQARRTVMDLVKDACLERVYPVGRLDRNTTGVLLLTNDGNLAKKLTHPKHGVKKLYHVVLDKSITKDDVKTISEGVKLDNETVAVDSISYAKTSQSKKEVGIEIHSGQNRVVRRIFEKLGYKVVKLDRVMFAGLTKKNLPRGKYRLLTEKEVNFLKMSSG